MSESTAPPHNRRSINNRACDSCRIARKTCIRNEADGPCERCGSPDVCSPGRTAEQYRGLLCGDHGFLKYPVFHHGGLRNLSDASYARMKEAQKEMWEVLPPRFTSPDASASSAAGIHGADISTSVGGSSLPDHGAEGGPSDDAIFSTIFDTAQSVPPWPHTTASPSTESLLPEDSTSTGSSTGAPYSDFPTTHSNTGSYASSVSTLVPYTQPTQSSFTLSHPGRPSTPFREGYTPEAQAFALPSTGNADPLNLLSQLDRLKVGYKHFHDHIKLLRDQKLDGIPQCLFLVFTEQRCTSQMASLIDQIESTLSNPGNQNDGLLYGFYETLINDINGYGLPSNRQTSILMNALNYYRKHGFSGKAESVCHLLKTIDGYENIAVESIQNICNDVTAAYNMLSQELSPELLHPTPLPFLHRALKFPSLFLAILESQLRQGTGSPQNVIGQNIIHAAAHSGDAKLLKASLQHFPALIEERDRAGRSPLFIATTANNAEASELLLDRGASPENRDSSCHTMLELCAGLGYLSIVQLLVKHRALLHSKPVLTLTPLQAAAAGGHSHVVEFLLQEGGCEAGHRTLVYGQTARDLALSHGHSDIARRLELES